MVQGNADERILALASRQHGVVTRSQLLAAGVAVGAISHRLKKGTLQSLHRGVYRTGPITARFQPEMAAALACGPEAVLSDLTAAGIWDMMSPRQPDSPVDVAGPRSLRGPASGVHLHRRGTLEDDEVVQRHSLPLTTPARTVLDLAAQLDPYQLERVLARALARNLVTVDAVQAMLLRHPRRKGCRTLRMILADATGPALTRSEAEARCLALLRKGGVPRPRTNAVVRGLEVDFFWPDRGVIVEVDGYTFHSHRNAFENDRRRDSILAADNLLVIRLTWRQIQNEPEKVLVRLGMALGARTRGPGREEAGDTG